MFALNILSSGQTVDDESNWYKETGRHDDFLSRFDFTRYTRSDVESATAKYQRITSAAASDEWVGTYKRQTMLGRSELTWDRNNGFVYAYVYHTLAGIDYGKVISTGHSVTFVPERPTPPKRQQFFKGEHIQVKFGERHLLVPKDRLEEFAIWAAGREVATGRRAKEINVEEGFFWEKHGETDKEIADVPTFPAQYKHLIQRPIRIKVVSVGKMRIKRERSEEWGTTSEVHHRSLRLSGGHRHGVRLGMRFWVDELDEWIEITSVKRGYSLANLHRPFIEGKQYCNTYEKFDLFEFQCRDPKVGMTALTRTDYF